MANKLIEVGDGVVCDMHFAIIPGTAHSLKASVLSLNKSARRLFWSNGDVSLALITMFTVSNQNLHCDLPLLCKLSERWLVWSLGGYCYPYVFFPTCNTYLLHRSLLVYRTFGCFLDILRSTIEVHPKLCQGSSTAELPTSPEN